MSVNVSWVEFSSAYPAAVADRFTMGVFDTASPGLFAGDGAKGVLVWGAQLEEGSLSSYTPTARAADYWTDGFYSSVPENDYPEWSSATAYTVGQKVIITATHKVYEALTAHTNKPPATSPVDWLDLGATNRWKMFDQKVGTATTAVGTITVTLSPGSINSLALLNVVCSTVRVRMVDPTAGVVYDDVFSPSDVKNIADWYAYFTAPLKTKTTIIVEGLPDYAAATTTLTLTNATGGDVSVGSCIIGTIKQYARAVGYGASIGIQDYSRKERDQFGNYFVVERAFAKRARWSFMLSNGDIDTLYSQLAGLRATPAVYIGSDEYDSSILYGFYRDFDIVIPYPNMAECSMEIEGLV